MKIFFSHVSISDACQPCLKGCYYCFVNWVSRDCEHWRVAYSVKHRDIKKSSSALIVLQQNTALWAQGIL